MSRRRTVLIDLVAASAVAFAVALTVALTAGCVVATREAPADPPPTRDAAAPGTATSTPGMPDAEANADAGGEEFRQMEREMEQRTNAIRGERDLGTLEPREDLRELGRRYSCRMASEGFFAHEAPGGATVDDRAREAGVAFTRIGENLAQVTNAPDPVDFMMQGWMDSPGHRENILREGFEAIGIGLCRSGETIYATQIFLTPR